MSTSTEHRAPELPADESEVSEQQAILDGLRALRRGDFDVRLPPASGAAFADVREAFNELAELNQRMGRELRRISRLVGRHGHLGTRASIPGATGGWARNVSALNELVEQLTQPANEVTRVLGAVAAGDLSERMAADVTGRPLRGEFLRWAELVNTMVDQLNAFASEVTRVAREVGTEGKLGGQADVRGVGGTWKDLTDSVNSMAGNLTGQVRNIAEVTTAVAQGDLSKKITVDVHGVGGTWKDLTDSVNLLAANLTTQVRAIGEVATAVTRGDLSRSIQVAARGEVEVLKDDVNEMIRRLRDTTRENAEQVWLKTNLARFSGMLQGQRDPETVGRLILSELAPLVGVLNGVIYQKDGDEPVLVLVASYARQRTPAPPSRIAFGEGLVGQCATERRRIVVRDVPPEYLTVNSAVGAAPPRMIVVLPVLFEGEAQAVIELATLDPFTEVQLAFLEQLAETAGIVLSTIAANRRAEAYLREQAARAEAEAGLARLRQVVDAMPEGILLADEFGSVYLHNAAAVEIMGQVPRNVLGDHSDVPSMHRLDGSECPPDEQPLARAILRREIVRGEQLIVTNAVTSRGVPILVNSVPLSDGSEVRAGGVAVFQDITPLHELDLQRDQFLAAVSHDLKNPVAIIRGRTDLLRRALDRSPDLDQLSRGLQTIETSTMRLVRLIDELLDLTRLRMGHPVELNVAPTDLAELVRRTADEHQQMHAGRVISVSVDGAQLVGEWDATRIERVIANLLSNAVKYSDADSEITVVASAEQRAGRPWAVLEVSNRGIGIPRDEVERVFDTYYRGTNVSGSIGGTGVGLAGARHIVEQHGGEIAVDSLEGQKTTFTVRLPVTAGS